MTETSYQYGIISYLPVASPATYLLLIDSRVSNYQDIINAAQPGVYHIVFDAPTSPTHSKILIKNIEDKIAELGVGAFTSIGLVQHNDEKPVYEMFGRISDIIKPRISAVERDDPDFQSWNSVALFLTMLRQNYGIEYFDMMACALYSNPDWKYIIDKLTALTGVTVRASTDDTGAASLGGDWFLESHTGVNLKDIYFTDAIDNYNGLLYTPPPSPAAVPTKKLILIDHRIKDIDVIINAMNDDTYCLVFNYFYDTPASILSKLRFLNSDNRYILDHFHYETPEIPTQMDASGTHCVPCADFDITDIQLLPVTLQNEYLEYMTSAAAAADDASGNGGLWPFHSKSTNITINKPAFFQRARLVEPAAEYNSANYKPRPMVLVSDLDEFYVLGQDVGEIVGGSLAFECVGIIQHTVDPYIGYKFIGGGDDSVSPAIVQDVVAIDSSLSSWAAFSAFIQSIKSAHQTTTLDMMACALYANPDWKYIIDTLAVRENITIRASLDNTGSAANDADANWVLETDNVSLTTVYFTDKIYAWKYVLATYIDTRFNALRWNNNMYATRPYDSRLKIVAGYANFTIETWYYETTTRFNCTIVDMGNYNYTFQIRNLNIANPKGLSLYNLYSGWNFAESAVVPVAQWSHLAVSRSGTTFTFYVNGIARQTFTDSNGYYSNDSTFAIGLQNPGPGGDDNKMKLDTVLYDIRLWNVARTDNEIRMYRNRVVPANSTGLVANYLCTDNGSSLNDRTSNALHTTLQSYDASRWSNTTVPIPNIGFLINNSYSLRTTNTGTALNALTHFDNITHTDFSGVDLSGVNFRGADLTGCNFTNANLTNTDFTNATVLNITTTNATTTGSSLSSAIASMSAETVLNLDGVNDAVDLGFPETWSPNTTPFIQTMTVECWFKTADTNNQKSAADFVSRWVTGGIATQAQFMVGMNANGQIYCYTGNTEATIGLGVLSPLTYKDTLWHHAAITFNGSTGTLNLYVDGALITSTTNVNHGNLSSTSTGLKLIIGSDHAGVVASQTDRQFRGSISDVRIWNVMRSPSEIADNYRMRLIGNETGLLGYWKLNQGRGSGWGSYSAVMDSTFRPNGTIVNAGATPSGSWGLSNLKFQPRVGTMTLGTNNGVYNFSDSSFSFIDPISNSLGDFSYIVSPSSVASVTNGAETMKTIYSLSAANLVPTYTLYEFPVLADLAGGWQIDISFTVTGGAGTYRAVIGDMFNNINYQGWRLFVSPSNQIRWSWAGSSTTPATISVNLNTPYILTAAQSSGTLTLTFRTVSTGATQTESFSVGTNVIGRGPVTIGNWINTGAEYFPGTISYVNVSVPTNQRVVTISSATDADTPTSVTAIQDTSFDFGSGSKTASLTVNKVAPTIGALSIPAKTINDVSFNIIKPTSNSTGLFSYTSSHTNVATVTKITFTTTSLLARYDTTQTSNYTLSGSTVTQWNDLTGNGYHLIPNGTGPTISTINSVTAFDFNSGRGFVRTSVPLSSTITVFMVIKYSTNIGTWGSFMHHGDRNSDWAIERNSWTNALTSHNVQFQSNNVNGPPELSTTNNVNYILIGRISGSTREFWRYSDTEALGFSTGTDVSIVTGNKSLFVGRSENNESCNSMIGEILYYNSALSNADVSANLGYLQNKWFNNLDTPSFLTIVGAGTSTITATQASTSNYNDGSVSGTFTVNLITPTFQAFAIPTSKNFGEASFSLGAPVSDSSGIFRYSSSNLNAATVTSSGLVGIVGAGTTIITVTQDAYGNFTTRDISGTLEVLRIAPTYQAIAQLTKTYGTDVSFSMTSVMTGVSDSSGAYTFSSTSDAIDICGGVATILAYTPSAITITATQAELGNYTASSTTFTLLVNRKTPTYGEFSVPAKTYGDASFSIAPYAPTTDSSNVPFTYTSSNQAVATINSNGTVVTIIGQGYTTITASQDPSGNYAANSITTSFLVNRAAPTFLKTFTIPNKTFGDVSFSLLPFTEGLDNTDGTYHFTSSNAELVSISGVDGVTATIHAYTPTPITIYVAIDACGNYAASSTSGTLNVIRATPTFGTFTVPAKNFGNASFTLTAPTSNSNGAFTFTSDASNVATVTSEGTVSIVGAGSANISVSQDASGNYNTRTVSGELVVSPIAPTIGTFTIPQKNINDSSFNISDPSSNSTGAFTYTIDSSNVATITSSGEVSLVGVGTATITATQAASTNYTSGSVSALLEVNAVLSNFVIAAKRYDDAPFDLTNPDSLYSNEPFTFSIVGDTTIASIGGAAGRTVTILKAGETQIRATQAATAEHAEVSITATLVVSKLTPVITLASITKTYGDASFNLAPSSTNTDTAAPAPASVFSFSSSNTSIASIFDTSYVSITGVGTATITMTQPATTNFTDASGTLTIEVIKATPVLSAFTVSSNKTYGSLPFSALALPTSLSDGTIVYSSSDNNVATIDNSGVITLVASGFVTFTATQIATAFYNQATKASNTMTVHRKILLLERSSPTDATINKTYGDSYFTVSATNASNGGAITYETDNPSVAGVINASTGVISVVSVGTATITARRVQTAQYTSEPISWTVEVARLATTLSGLVDLSYNVTAEPFTVSASSISDGAVTYSLQDPTSTVLTIDSSSGLVTLRSAGTAVIVASQAPGTLYQTPATITATITVTPAGNALQGATITDTTSFASVNLSGASLEGVTITNTTFAAATLSNVNMTNAVITGANFTGADLSGATLSGATITSATFTDVSLKSADLSGAIMTSTVFTGSDLSGANLTRVDASGSSFVNANLNNVDLTGANIENVNFTNTSIKDAVITDISFSPLQKIQLLKNTENRDIGQIIIPEVSGPTILAAISTTSPLRAIPNLDLSSASVIVSVVVPTSSPTPAVVLQNIVLNVTDYDKFYLPINQGEFFQIDGVKYFTSEGLVMNYATNSVVEVITYEGKSVWLLAGSVVGLVLQTNTLSASSFVVPSHILYTNTTPFMATTLPTSNSNAPIVYSSSNTNVATIDASSGLITPTGIIGHVTFTATQVQNATYGPGTITSNIMVADKAVNFALIGLNQTFNLSTLAELDANAIIPDTTDATAVFYVRLSDMLNVFKYQTDSADINDLDVSDIKYYVFHRKWPTELKINPSHAMMDKAESSGKLGENFTSDRSLMKHDFIRYLALRLFNTVHGVDLFRNESDLRENMTYFGENVRYNIDSILSGISTTSSSVSMSYDASANKYLTNDSSGNTNLCRDLMRQVAAHAPSRFYNNGGNTADLRNVPFVENDTITFNVIVESAADQNVLTGVSSIPSRSYTIKLILNNTVTSETNTVVSDSEMYPNAYPYSSSVMTYAPTTDSSGVYNIYSPPAPIPLSRFGYNGWYYTNSSAWVNVAPGVRNHIKWLVSANTVSSTVADLRFVRLNLKIHNNASLPYLMIYTQAGSTRKYAVIGGNGSLTNGTLYSMYINFGSYLDEPAMIGYTNAALVNTIGSGSFASNEIITSIAIETESNASAGNVEFTLASIIVGELSPSSGLMGEKEYGFEAEVPSSYP